LPSAVPQEMNGQQTSTWIDFPPNSSTLRLKLKMLFWGKWKKLCCVQGRRTADDYFTITG
jgi:hypothetical protein